MTIKNGSTFRPWVGLGTNNNTIKCELWSTNDGIIYHDDDEDVDEDADHDADDNSKNSAGSIMVIVVVVSYLWRCWSCQ